MHRYKLTPRSRCPIAGCLVACALASAALPVSAMQKDSRPAQDQKSGVETTVPGTPAEMFQSLKLRAEQKALFEPLEEEQRAAEARFRKLSGEALRKAQNDFRKERRKKIREIFTEEQWNIWSTYWSRQRTGAAPTSKAHAAAAPAPKLDLSKTPVIQSEELDRFGGWKEQTFEDTGFFHTHHDGKRWWLVTPGGHPFIALGLNHFHHAHWKASYDADHWLKQFGARRPLDKQWRQGFRNEALALCRKLGINALGVNNEAKALTNPIQGANPPQGAILPYVRRYLPVVLSHYTYPKAEQYHDVFAPEFVTHCEQVAREQAAPYKDDPMLIGYIMSDAPRLTDRSVRGRPPGATTFLRVLRNLGPDAPGKQAYVSLMRQRHHDISRSTRFTRHPSTTGNHWQWQRTGDQRRT